VNTVLTRRNRNMAQIGARSVGASGRDDAGRARRSGFTPAQWYCLLVGLTLLLVGIFGFLADASFDTSASSDADRLGNADGALQGGDLDNPAAVRTTLRRAVRDFLGA